MKAPALAEKRSLLNALRRQAHNIRLALLLSSLVLEHKNLRFSQILLTFGFIKKNNDGTIKDEYYVEPEEILNRAYETKRGIE